MCVTGEVKAAGAHLSQVFGQEPREAAAQARVGVVEAWQQNHRLAALGLSTLAQKDTSSLDFLLALVPPSHKKRMAQVGQPGGPQGGQLVSRYNGYFLFLL